MSRSRLCRQDSEQLLPGPAFPTSPIRVEVVHYLGVDGPTDRVQISPADARPGVVVVAREPGERIAVIRQFRAALDAEVWELPRGLGSSGSPAQDAARELEEETGARAHHLEPLGHIHPDPGVQRQQMVVVRARVPEATTQPSDVEEIAEVAWWTPGELCEAVRTGVLRDGISLAALHVDAVMPG